MITIARNDPRMKEFLDAYAALCKTHGFSLSHEDGQGAFLVEDYDQTNVDWVDSALHDSSKSEEKN